MATVTNPAADTRVLAAYRIAFGAVMLYSTIRFAANGWIADFYIRPKYHFSYLGMGWVRPLPGDGMYWLFALMAVCAAGVMVGGLYRPAILTFTAVFTYVELIDKAFYLNHYYLVSVMGCLMIGVPLNRRWAVDSWLRPALRADSAPRWALTVLRVQIGLVYFYAGVAKLHGDWLIEALPLRMWLPARADLPVIGPLLEQRWVAYAFSWAGAAYDLTIPFWLSWRRSRPFAFAAVIGFHAMTAILFPVIGVFPLVMLACSVVFLPSRAVSVTLSRPFPALIGVFLVIQAILPLRHYLYPGDVLWTEEGFRFSWRVMLVDKVGDVLFTLKDRESGAVWYAFPDEYLTPLQARQMAFQPDMILQFAHHLADQHGGNVAVYAEAYVGMNGRPARLIIDPTVDLAAQPDSLWAKSWLLR
jgi:hypothetical protein